MGYFMDIGEQELVRAKVVVEGDPGVPAGAAAGEVSDFGLPAFRDFQLEGRCLPEAQAIVYSRCWNMSLKNSQDLFYSHIK